jgi:hypothetical protein
MYISCIGVYKGRKKKQKKTRNKRDKEPDRRTSASASHSATMLPRKPMLRASLVMRSSLMRAMQATAVSAGISWLQENYVVANTEAIGH